MKYNIYAGLGGSFGGPRYEGTLDSTLEEAEHTAYELAVEEYQSYEGFHGIMTWEDVAEAEGLNPNEDMDSIDEAYQDEIESWIEYYVVPFDEDPIDSEEYYEI